MPSPQRPSLLVRAATLTLAVGTLTGLVVHTSMAAGCSSSGPTTAPTATPDPASNPAPTSATTSASPSGQAPLPLGASAAQGAAPTNTPSSGPVLKPGGDYFPASKSGGVFHMQEPPPPQQKAAPQQKAPPPQNAAPAGQVR